LFSAAKLLLLGHVRGEDDFRAESMKRKCFGGAPRNDSGGSRRL